MSDDKTMAAYAKAAEDYAAGCADTDGSGHDADYQAFVAGLPAAARILDFGCGPGQWAARFRDAGYQVAAVDASPEMAAQAEATHGIAVTVADFEDLAVKAVFDGVWAHFSLLHASRDDFPSLLLRVRAALVPGGRLSLGMKVGEGEHRDRLGRFYSYYTEEELCDILGVLGYTVVSTRRGTGTGLAGAEEAFVVVTAHA